MQDVSEKRGVANIQRRLSLTVHSCSQCWCRKPRRLERERS